MRKREKARTGKRIFHKTSAGTNVKNTLKHVVPRGGVCL